MADFYEIDFLDVESEKSGDAIPLRYQNNGAGLIHVVDGGFQQTGDKVVGHIKKHYGDPTFIHHVVVTHPDGDHAGGVQKVLEEFQIGGLWMLRPWLYANELIDRFKRFSNVDNLVARLKEIYPSIATLEEIASDKGIPIFEPFQGAQIGAFVVLAPSKTRYLDLIVESDKTPEGVTEATAAADSVGIFKALIAKAVKMLRAAWGEELFSDEETSAENEMSVVQYASLCGDKILLTGDAGRQALGEAADFAPFVGLNLPGIQRVQVPHHGSRRNVSTETLDRWLGPRLASKPADGEESFIAVCSSAKKDEDHPRKAVIRGFIHRGAKFLTTEDASIRISRNAGTRDGWGPAAPVSYPDEQEE